MPVPRRSVLVVVAATARGRSGSTCVSVTQRPLYPWPSIERPYSAASSIARLVMNASICTVEKASGV
jgi:hypothetical protein